MSLPPGFLDELRNRLSMTQVAGRKVMWDNRKSNQGKGDMWAPCPFHQEKTASFHVDDRKGYYYCFGCHAKGDMISFVKETENVSFMEAVEILAGEAGLQMPARDPRAKEKQDRRAILVEIAEAAVQFFRLQLNTGAGADARAYLAKRGLDPAAWDRWDIGFAPASWEALRSHLQSKGYAPEMIVAAGLAKMSDRGRAPYDVFRNRIMFPIRDARGRAMAFGGRAMDPSDNAKYLNSPECELFDKGRSLFNHGPGREAVGKGKTLIVAEGYMDVIALGEAGFTGAVAPLGTAITEDQLRLLWRIDPEPVIALDGDTAGLRAAMRVIDLALPMLEAGKSLRFCVMPPGKDPDDVIKVEGAEAMQSYLDGARPLVSLLWQRETEGKTFDSPERKAALDKILRQAIAKIQDPSLRAHYGEEIKRLRYGLFNPPRRWQPWRKAPEGPVAATRSSALTVENGAENLREAVILAAILKHPEILPEFEAELEILEFGPENDALRRAVLRFDADPENVRNMLGNAAVDRVLTQKNIAIVPAVRDGSTTEMAHNCVREELQKLMSQRGSDVEIAEAMEDLDDPSSACVDFRLSQAVAERQRAEMGFAEDKIAFQTAPNGARLDKNEVSALDSVLRDLTFKKPNRRS